MSFPNIPDVDASIDITVEEAVTLLLASIAFEELGLAHIINAEAEKIQYILGTLENSKPPAPPSIDDLLKVNRSVDKTLKNVIKKEMLLQFKLEDTLSISTTTTSTTTSTTTTCNPGLQYAVFANGDCIVNSASVIKSDVQVNGNLALTHDNNVFHGHTNVAGTYSDNGGNRYDNLVLDAPSVPFRSFNTACLYSTADLIIDDDVTIDTAEDAAAFQGKTVWVNGSVTINAPNVTITGGGILARDQLIINGECFKYRSTECFALYSDTEDVVINSGPYNIIGLLYAKASWGNIKLNAEQGGTISGALIAGNTVEFNGECAKHKVNNTMFSVCSKCSDYCYESCVSKNYKRV